MIILWCANAVIGVVLTAMLLNFRRRFSLSQWVSNGEDSKKLVPHSITVVIAARNEERDIARTLREFAALPCVGEIILVDDGSEDNTLQIARSVASDNSHIRVFKAPPLPSGWVGKTHAVHWASKFAVSDTDLFLFTDADVHLHQMPLQEIVSCMDIYSLDHVGGNFRLELLSFSDAVVGPVLATVAFVSFGLSASQKGAASGAFNLVRKSVYYQIKGHFPIRDRVIDDVALARYLKNRGFMSRFVDISPVLSVRLFQGFKGFASAVSRSAVPFLGSRPFLSLILSIIGVILSLTFLLMPVVLLTSIATLSANGMSNTIHACGIILTLYVFATIPFILASWMHSRSRWWGLLSPIGLVIMTFAVTIAAIRCMFGLEVRWRGRSYPLMGNNTGRNKV